MDVRAEKVKELMNDEVFVAKSLEANNVDELTALFVENGADLTTTQVENLMKAAAQAAAENDELGEDQLQAVAGGVSLSSTWKACTWAFKQGWKWGSKFYDWEKSLYR